MEEAQHLAILAGAADKHKQETSFISHGGILWIRGGASARVNSTKASTFFFSASFFS